jgi:hypothetical protein
MFKMISKLSLCILGVFLFTGYCSAISVPGYIITENSDTLAGTIHLNKFDQTNGSLIISGFDVESLYSKVSFKTASDKRFKTYEPGSILGFGFSYKSTLFIFKSFTLKRNSLVKSEREQSRFLCLVYQGYMSLFKDIEMTQYNPSNFAMNNTGRYSEYFLFQPSKGLVKVERIDGVKSMKELLRQFNCNEQFLKEMPETAEYWNVKAILESYDNWLSANENEKSH